MAKYDAYGNPVELFYPILFVEQSFGVVGGLYLSQLVGNTIEKQLSSTASLPEAVGWLANNGSKLVMHFLFKGLTKTMMLKNTSSIGLVQGIYLSIPASIFLDTYTRATGKKFLNMTERLTSVNEQKELDNLQTNMSKAIQDNAAIRTQLNSALQRLEQARNLKQ